jgi:hypothetical protein
MLRVLSTRQHCLATDFGSLPDLNQSEDGHGLVKIFKRERVDGEKLFASSVRIADAQTLRILFDGRLKSWGVKDAAHRTLISSLCCILCQTNVQRIRDISDLSILATPERICSLIHLATQPSPGEGEFRGEVRHAWSSISLSAIQSLVELADTEQGRNELVKPGCQALSFIASILDHVNSYPSNHNSVPALSSAVASDGRVVVAAATVVERLASDRAACPTLVDMGFHLHLIQLLQLSVKVTTSDVPRRSSKQSPFGP